jgi:hypothetical protein
MKKGWPICAELLSQYLRAQQMPNATIKQQGLNSFTIHNLLYSPEQGEYNSCRLEPELVKCQYFARY